MIDGFVPSHRERCRTTRRLRSDNGRGVDLRACPFRWRLGACGSTAWSRSRSWDVRDALELSGMRSTVTQQLWYLRRSPRAGVAQLAERQPSKLHVASSNLVSRSKHSESYSRSGSAVPASGRKEGSLSDPPLTFNPDLVFDGGSAVGDVKYKECGRRLVPRGPLSDHGLCRGLRCKSRIFAVISGSVVPA